MGTSESSSLVVERDQEEQLECAVFSFLAALLVPGVPGRKERRRRKLSDWCSDEKREGLDSC